jgi:hypothetical protein
LRFDLPRNTPLVSGWRWWRVIIATIQIYFATDPLLNSAPYRIQFLTDSVGIQGKTGEQIGEQNDF